MEKTLVLYADDKKCGVIRYTDIKIGKDHYIYGGEKKYIYEVYIYLNENCIFSAIDKKEIIKQDKKLFIYNFN